MEKTVVILQSNYIPWKGYFDLIQASDEFIFYDEVQYTHSDWRNRNRIKTRVGLHWLTIPVGRNLSRKINEVEMVSQHWKAKHRRSLHHSYSKAPFYRELQPLLDKLYLNSTSNLSEYNQNAIKDISRWMGIQSKFTDSTIYNASGKRSERLLEIVKKAGGKRYLCGPKSRNYLDEKLFNDEGIEVVYFDYSNYKIYEQLYPPFTHDVSVLDLLFNTGPQARMYLKSSG